MERVSKTCPEKVEALLLRFPFDDSQDKQLQRALRRCRIYPGQGCYDDCYSAGMQAYLYCDFPSEHWTRIRTNNVIERLNREIRRRTRVVGTFPDGNSALMLVCARLRHVAGTQWGNKKYMNMKHLEAALDDASIAG